MIAKKLIVSAFILASSFVGVVGANPELVSNAISKSATIMTKKLILSILLLAVGSVEWLSATSKTHYVVNIECINPAGEKVYIENVRCSNIGELHDYYGTRLGCTNIKITLVEQTTNI